MPATYYSPFDDCKVESPEQDPDPFCCLSSPLPRRLPGFLEQLGGALLSDLRRLLLLLHIFA